MFHLITSAEVAFFVNITTTRNCRVFEEIDSGTESFLFMSLSTPSDASLIGVHQPCTQMNDESRSYG